MDNLSALIADAKKNAGLPVDEPLESLVPPHCVSSFHFALRGHIVWKPDVIRTEHMDVTHHTHTPPVHFSTSTHTTTPLHTPHPGLLVHEVTIRCSDSYLCDFAARGVVSISPPPQGMALSGGEQKEAQEKIIKGFQERYPNTSRHYCVRTDTFGSIATAFQAGG